MKKIISSIVVIAFLLKIIIPVSFIKTVGAQWTIQDATHLAKRALIGATPKKINELYQAGSAKNAVDILFPDINGPEMTNYNKILNDFTSLSGFNINSYDSMNKYYQLKYYYDPYEAKRKLFMVFEDIFASGIDGGKKINYIDIENTHKLIYKYMFGSYKDLIKKIIFTDGKELGDYTEGAYLDLFNQVNKNYPNENYARELLQLFLMDEYKPNESSDLGSIRNYEETDVASLAKILFGFKTDHNNTVYYEPPSYTGSDIKNVEFLTGSLKSGDESKFSNFYNTESGTINLEQIQKTGSYLINNLIDYIFSKREDVISLFLANKLYKFYVYEKPTTNELIEFSNIIKQNDFNIFNSVKWLLSSDHMYSEKSKNEIRYKNPIELGLGTLKIINQDNPNYIEPILFIRSDILVNLGWIPYQQFSIFGRPGFDSNDNFYNANIHNKWISIAPRISYGYGISSNNKSKYNVGDKLSSLYNFFKNNTYTGIVNYTQFTEIDTVLLEGKTIIGTGIIKYSSGNNIVTNNLYEGIFLSGGKKISTNIGEIITNVNSLIMSGSEVIGFTGGSINSSGVIHEIIEAKFYVKNAGKLERSLTENEVIKIFEDRLVLGKGIDFNTKTKLINFLQTDENGNKIIFNLDTQKEKIESLGTIIMTLPEFILLSGFNENSDIFSEKSFLNDTNSKLILVNLNGGYDYLNDFFNIKDKDYIRKIRPNIYNKKDDEIIQIGDYYMSKNIAYGSGNTIGLKDMYDLGFLKIFNRVGTKNHSRDHDQASKAIASCNSFTVNNSDGTFGKFIKQENPSNTIVIGNSKPYILRNGNYINIGSHSNILTNERLSITKRNQYLNTIKDIINNKIFPGKTFHSFKESMTIDQIGQLSLNSSLKRDGSGNGNFQNYEFIKTMMENNYGKVFYLNGDGLYDTHDKQGNSLDTDINKVITSMVGFFNQMKDTQDITIVVYSEFGRTLKENGGKGTDHGKGGIMLVLSNNNKLRDSMPGKIYGNLDLEKEKEDFLGVGIYYDSIYDKIISALYGKTNIFSNKLEEDIDISEPKIYNFNSEIRSYYGSNNNFFTNISFDIDSKNFEISAASNVKIKYGTGIDNLKNTINNWELFYTKNPIVKDKKVNFTKNISGPTFAYEITVQNNQYIQKVFTGIINTGLYSTGGNQISENNDTFLQTYKNGKTISGNETLTNPIILGNVITQTGTTSTGTTSTGIILPNFKILTKGNSVSLKLHSGTTKVEKLSGSGTWNGRFILGDIIDKDLIFSSGSKTSSGDIIDKTKINKVVKFGADSLGISLKLNQDVSINIDNVTPLKKYNILFSEDLKTWKYLTESTSTSTGSISFKTNHFTYFALYEAPVIDNGSGGGSSGGGGGGSGGGGGGGLSIDNCPTGDYSPSYYDRNCGIKPLENNISKVDDVKENITPDINKKDIGKDIQEKIIKENRIKYIKYLGQDIIHIRRYKYSKITFSLSIKIMNSKLDNINKRKYINIINNYIISKYILDIISKYNIEIPEKKLKILEDKHKQYNILLKSILETK